MPEILNVLFYDMYTYTHIYIYIHSKEIYIIYILLFLYIHCPLIMLIKCIKHGIIAKIFIGVFNLINKNENYFEYSIRQLLVKS